MGTQICLRYAYYAVEGAKRPRLHNKQTEDKIAFPQIHARFPVGKLTISERMGLYDFVRMILEDFCEIIHRQKKLCFISFFHFKLLLITGIISMQLFFCGAFLF